MSFVPQPQRQNANSQNAVTPAPAPAEVSDAELIFNLRTFDLYFIDRIALMYKAGIDKVSCANSLSVVGFVVPGTHGPAILYIRLLTRKLAEVLLPSSSALRSL